MSAGPQPPGHPEIAGERWRDAVAELDYAERHGASSAELERLAADVIEARIELFRAGVRGGWQLPAFLQAALERDRLLLETRPSLQPLPRSGPPAPSAGGADARPSAGGDGDLAAGR